MEQKFKRYLKTGISFFIICICFASCNDDEVLIDEKNITESKYKIEIKTESDFYKNLKLANKLEKFKKVKTNQQSRDVQNSEYGFTIDTDYAKYVEFLEDNTHSYTFPIIRDQPNEITENLVLSLQADGTYKAFIVAYYFPDFDNIGVKSQEIDLDSSTILNDIQQRECVSWFSCNEWINICNCDNPEDTEWICTSVTYNQICDQSEAIVAGPSAGGGGITTTGTNPDSGSQWNNTIWTSGGGSNSSNTGSTNISPTVITSPFTINSSHIKSLNRLTEKPQIKDKIAYLKTKTTGDIEYGFQFNRNGNTNLSNYYNISSGIPDVDNHGFKFEPPASFLTDAQMHNHYAGAASAFTSRDLFNFVKQTNNSNNPDIAAILVAPNLKVYALKINNVTLAAEFAENYLTNNKPDKDKIKTMEIIYVQEVIDKANEECAGTCSDAVFNDLINKYLASYLVRVYSGLTLYEATEDSDGNFTWNVVLY
ncbi:hypothetical protein [uncultured Lacinutrix sp.]|uniref:hypothetical protein n=1 Tax=uncultured Lacinutrix sp. TaxID=574032 RepID=UPI00260B3267|nr:hypothetical protein [uncultured Lacinutrix sp.]